jgi:hypothetical protein
VAGAALVMERLVENRGPSRHGGAWGRAGLIEATERVPASRDLGFGCYVSRARSTRGATRA